MGAGFRDRHTVTPPSRDQTILASTPAYKAGAATREARHLAPPLMPLTNLLSRTGYKPGASPSADWRSGDKTPPSRLTACR